jgi:hypothetical protein
MNDFQLISQMAKHYRPTYATLSRKQDKPLAFADAGRQLGMNMLTRRIIKKIVHRAPLRMDFP